MQKILFTTSWDEALDNQHTIADDYNNDDNRIRIFVNGEFSNIIGNYFAQVNPDAPKVIYISDEELDAFGISQHDNDLEDVFKKNLLQSRDSLSMPIPSDNLKACTQDTTSVSSQRELNSNLMNELEKKSPEFKYILHHTTFEDGYTNEAIDFFYKIYEKDHYISMLWLQGVYVDNQNDPLVVEGILRILSFSDDTIVKKFMIPLVKASFNHPSLDIQETAIMVAETWRNQACLEALETSLFASPYMQMYSQKVIKELKEELKK